MSSKLAILGGTPVREEPFATGYEATNRTNIDEAEIEAVTDVLRSQRLSGFVADSSEAFFGGPKVREFERACAEYFDVEYCVAVNSWTSGLFACVGACGFPPGSEIIVPPITMSATASAILGNDCIPVFADVEEDTANIDPDSVRDKVTDDTEAILPVHIFGYPAEMEQLQAIADEEDLVIIEDAAQAVGATYDGEYAGTIGDIGGISLNVHKHIHAGEGGVIMTDDERLARRAQLIRNHGETVVSDLEGSALGELDFEYTDIVGQNYRMTELVAAVGVEQLRKLPDLRWKRVERAELLRSELASVEIVSCPPVRENSTHSYYGFPLWYDPDIGGVDLAVFLAALEAEGVPASKYVEPLYNLPVYQEGNVHDNGQVATGPVNGGRAVEYPADSCPTAERLYADRLLVTDTVVPETTEGDVCDIAAAFAKLDANRDVLADVSLPEKR
jgi:dTDP-4-amino-4,6-dideoxygalactose transaminase